MVSPILTSQNFDKEFVLQIYASDVFFRNFSLFSPRALTTQVFTIFTMYAFFPKIPRDGKWANLVSIMAWMERRRFEKNASTVKQ